MRNFLVKFAAISALAILLILAGSLVRGVVNDRIDNREAARASITESLAGSQTLAGPVLIVDYIEEWQAPVFGDKGEILRHEARSQRYQTLILPETLLLDGTLISDPRRRGIFQVNAWLLEGRLAGKLRVPLEAELKRFQADSRLRLTGASAAFALSDPRGLRKVVLTLDNQDLPLEAGTGLPGASNGAHAVLPEKSLRAGQTLDFTMQLSLAGSDGFSMVPLARETSASLNSRWPHPSFGGRFLPVSRNVGESGFEAQWRISALASNARQIWQNALEREHLPTADAFAVNLIDPVDIYSMSDRAAKYAELFIALTLGAFLLFELLRRLNLHPMNYLLISAALLIFFLLLVSLAEQIGFALAYLCAASACVLLIGFYSAHLLRSLWLASGFTAGLAMLYGALYFILLSEQNALLMGSLLLFGVIASVMIATRKLDWHALLARQEEILPEVA